MRAMVYRGPYKVRVEEKDMPSIEHPNDAVVRVSLGSLDQLPKNVQLQAGMPVEAMIRTGSRTFLEYLAKPITDFAGRGLHEG